VNAQHRAQRHRRTAIALLGVERFDQRHETRPRHDHLHLGQKHRFPGLLAGFGQETSFGQTQLLHRFHRFRGRYDNGAIFSNHAAWRLLMQNFLKRSIIVLLSIMVSACSLPEWLFNSKKQIIEKTLGQAPFSCSRGFGKIINRNVIQKNNHGIIYRVSINSCGSIVHAYQAIPQNSDNNTPVVIALHQTTNVGKDEVMGLGGDVNMAYGKKFFESGFIVISPDVFVAGENYNTVSGWDTGSFYQNFPNWSAMGKMLHDHLSTTRFARKEYPHSCIAVVGHSLGGHNALFLAAFEENIDVVVSSAGFESIATDTEAMRWSRDSWFVYMPLLRPYAAMDAPRQVPWDFDDLLKIIFPRPVMIIQGMNDDSWKNPESVESMVHTANVIYKKNGLPEINTIFHYYGHSFGLNLQQKSVDFVTENCRKKNALVKKPLGNPWKSWAMRIPKEIRPIFRLN
jgi:dienelactone hydrolase